MARLILAPERATVTITSEDRIIGSSRNSITVILHRHDIAKGTPLADDASLVSKAGKSLSAFLALHGAVEADEGQRKVLALQVAAKLPQGTTLGSVRAACKRVAEAKALRPQEVVLPVSEWTASAGAVLEAKRADAKARRLLAQAASLASLIDAVRAAQTKPAPEAAPAPVPAGPAPIGVEAALRLLDAEEAQEAPSKPRRRRGEATSPAAPVATV